MVADTQQLEPTTRAIVLHSTREDLVAILQQEGLDLVTIPSDFFEPVVLPHGQERRLQRVWSLLLALLSPTP